MEKNINAKKQLLIFGCVLLFAGCTRHENTVEAISSDKVLIKDVKDGKERVYIFDGANKQLSDIGELVYYRIGDTVTFNLDFMHNYNKLDIIHEGDDSYARLNNKQVEIRKRQARYDAVRAKVDSIKTAMLADTNTQHR